MLANDVEVLVGAATDHVPKHVPPQLIRGVGGLRVLPPRHTNVPCWGVGPSDGVDRLDRLHTRSFEAKKYTFTN